MLASNVGARIRTCIYPWSTTLQVGERKPGASAAAMPFSGFVPGAEVAHRPSRAAQAWWVHGVGHHGRVRLAGVLLEMGAIG